MRRSLLAWYARHARPLPWRLSADPYRIWISEIMLQQTTVAAVIPYFKRFLARFPTIRELAESTEEDVLRLWEGLGYYSRARHMHRAAQVIVQEHGGAFPDDVETLRSLPGIGRYTAGAIASFAFDRRAPIVEANTLRLYSRLVGLRADPRSAPGQSALWEFAERILPDRAPGRLNQALMELGATVCTPENPTCERCPLRRWCAAFASGTQAEIPQSRSRPKVTEITEIAIAIERDGEFLLRKRPAGQRWGGLWDFVRFPVGSDDLPTGAGAARKRRMAGFRIDAAAGAPPLARDRPGTLPDVRDLERQVRDDTGLAVDLGAHLALIRHSVTRYRITLHCFRATWRSGQVDGGAVESHWVSAERLGEYPLSVTGRKVANLLAGASSQ